MKTVAKIILMNDKKEFLFQLRDNYSYVIEPGSWALFGGDLEEGEEALTGMKRELEEELPGCSVKDISFIGKGYVEIRNLRLVNYWTDDKNKPNKFNDFVKETRLFRGIINEEIDFINKRIAEGPRAGYFRLDQFESIRLDPFAKDFIHKNKEKFFS